jgi:dTDP-4-dehydrorhamnose 3,5-epimerase
MPVTVEASEKIQGVHVVRFQKFGDERGYFYESFRKTWVPGVPEMIQGNCSFSKAGVLRGMHYHLKQADFWSVPAGRVRAALFDFRPASSTFGVAQVMDMGGEANIGLYIPKGVAHGFLAVEDCYMTYLVDQYYDGADELGIRWDDPEMALDWRLGAGKPNLSGRDATNPLIAEIPPERRPR